MYLPAHFEEKRPEELQRLMREHPLGILVAPSGGGFDANHLPFEFDPSTGTAGTLRAHVARANPIWQDVANGDDVLVIFRGNEAYVSPNWYPSKAERHMQVPTWDYMVVHAYGRITVRDDEPYVRALVARLTREHEAVQPQPWKMSDAPKTYIDQMLAAIVGIEIDVVRLAGKFKISQNKEQRDREGAAEALRRNGDERLAAAILAAPPAP